MYYYIYDIFTKEKKYSRLVEKIELMTADMGIGGKSYKLSVLKKLEDIIDEAVGAGVKNIIAVGNDQTVSKIANLIVDKNVVLGYVPVAEGSTLARVFGIGSIDEACKIISARKVAKLDVGRINDQYFLLSVEPPTKEVIFDFKNYNIRPKDNNEAVGVYNINIDDKNFRSNPEDGVMEVVFTPHKKKLWPRWLRKKDGQEKQILSVFPVKELTIKHRRKSVAVNIDRQRTLKTPLEIKILPQSLGVIVGKDRVF